MRQKAKAFICLFFALLITSCFEPSASIKINSFNDSPDPFSPNGDSIADTTTLTASITASMPQPCLGESYEISYKWIIKSSDGSVVVKELSGRAPLSISGKSSFAQKSIEVGKTLNITWDGANASGVKVSAGIYPYSFKVELIKHWKEGFCKKQQVVASSSEVSGDVTVQLGTLDTDPPMVSITNPLNGAKLDTNTPNITIAYSDDSSGIEPSSLRVWLDDVDVTDKFTANADEAYWDISLDDALDEGEHSVHASVADKAGNSADAVPVKFLVNADKPVETVESGWLDGIVYNSRTDEPIENAQITVNGVDGNLFTNSDGKYFFPTPTGGWYQIAISAPGYTSQYREIWVTPTRDVAIDPAYLVPIDSAVTHIVASEGGTAINSNNTVQVIIPAGAAPYDIDVTATWYEAPKELPMDLPKYSHFTMAFDLKPDGVTFNQPITVRAKNIHNFPAGTPVPMGYFDKEKFAWKPEGTAYVTEDGQWLEGQITHFSPRDWNSPYYAVCGANGCIYPYMYVDGGDWNNCDCNGDCSGSKVEYHSGRLQEWHSTVPYTSQGGLRNITLIYDSKRAKPEKIPITVNVGASADQSTMTRTTVYFEGQRKSTHTTVTNTSSVHRFLFSAVNGRGIPLLPGTYTYNVESAFRYEKISFAEAKVFGSRSDIELAGSQSPTPLWVTNSYTGRVAVTSQSLVNSSYGAGWNIEGIDKIYPLDPTSNSFLYMQGDGGYKNVHFRSIEEKLFDVDTNQDFLYADSDGNYYVANRTYPPSKPSFRSSSYAGCYGGVDILRYSPDGTREDFGLCLGNFGGLSLDSDGNIFVLDSSFNEVHVLANNGVDEIGSIALDPSGCQQGLAGDSQGNVYVGGCVIGKVKADLTYEEFSRETSANKIVVDNYDRLIGQGEDGALYRFDTYGFTKPMALELPTLRGMTINPNGLIAGVHHYSGGEFKVLAAASNTSADTLYLIEPTKEVTGILPSSLDTLSAVAAIPAEEDSLALLSAGAIYKSRMDTVAQLPEGDFGTLMRDYDGNFVYRYPDGTEKQFNSAGLMVAIVDTNGNATSYAYDSVGRVVSITDPVGKITNLEYDAQGRISRISDPVGRATIFNIDASGDLASITDPDGTIRNFTYNDHLMTHNECPSCGSANDYVFNNQGVVIKTIDAMGAERKYEPGAYKGAIENSSENNPATPVYPESMLDKYTDALGRVTFMQSDSFGRVLREIDPLSRETLTDYNGAHQPTRVVEPGDIINEYSYDERGNLISSLNANEGALTQLEYDPVFNKVTLARDPLGRETQFFYDDRGNLIEARDAAGNSMTFSYNSAGQLLTATDPMGAVMTFAYDALGNLQSITDALGNVTTMARDDAGNITSVTDPLGNTSSFAYDSMNRRTSYTDALGYMTYFAYDSKGRLTQITDAAGGITSFEYNAVGLLTEKTDPLGRVTQYAYDLERNLVNITDPAGRVTSYSYDDLDRLIAATDPMNYVTGYGYDEAGNLAVVTDAKGNQTTYGYNAFGQVTSVMDALGYIKQYQYDLAQNLTRAVYPKGNELDYIYDNINQLVEKDVYSPERWSENVYSYAYDNNGNLLNASNNNSYLEFAYDPLGQMVMAATNPAGNYSTPSATFHYYYDAAGNRISMTDPNGGITNYSYDNRKLLTEILNPYGELTQYAYDALGIRSSFMRANGVETTYTYDAASQVIAIDHLLGGTALDYFHYTYDVIGNRTSMTRPEGTHEYTYDDLDRLTGATHPWPELPTETFGYDPLGNRLGSAVDAGNRLLEDDDWTYTYDENGNMIGRVSKTKPESWYYYYNSEDRMIGADKYKIDDQGNEVPDSYSHYDYDALINRVGKYVYTNCDSDWNCEESGQFYVYVDEAIWGTYDLDGNQLYEVTQSDELDDPISLRETNSNGSHFYNQDALGTVWGLTGNNGNLESEFKFSSYGILIEASEYFQFKNLYAFTGREYDFDTGLYFHRLRFYDSYSGRFTSKDPLEYLFQNQSAYSYAYNNPLLYIDPYGLWSWSSFGKGVLKGAGYALAGAVVGVAVVAALPASVATAAIAGVSALGAAALGWSTGQAITGTKISFNKYQIQTSTMSDEERSERVGESCVGWASLAVAAAGKPYKMENVGGYEAKWSQDFRTGWHPLPSEGARAERIPELLRGRTLPHWHQRGPGGIGRHLPWEGGPLNVPQ